MDAAPRRAAAPLAVAERNAPRIGTLRFRRDFLRAAAARRVQAPGFLLQARERPAGENAANGSALIRVGFTCSKKIGNAVTRNRAKRRLRAAARLILPQHGRRGWDYVLIGRPNVTVRRDFAGLCADLRGALAAIHTRNARPPRRREARA